MKKDFKIIERKIIITETIKYINELPENTELNGQNENNINSSDISAAPRKRKKKVKLSCDANQDLNEIKENRQRIRFDLL